MPLSGLPSQTIVPSPSISRLITSGCTFCGGGGALGFGMSSLTACVMIGRDTISVTSSTSITSISGVVLMSHIASVEEPTLIAMGLNPSALAEAAHAVVGLGEEADLDDAAALDLIHDVPDRLEARVLIAADVNFRLRFLHRGAFDPTEEFVRVRQLLVVPVDLASLVDGDGDVLRLGLRRDVDRLRQSHLHRLVDDRDGDEKNDEQHQHHIHQRRGVDGGDSAATAGAP